MVLANPPSIWCMAQDCEDRNLIYAGAGGQGMQDARGTPALARSTDGGRSWTDITPAGAHSEDIWAVATPPNHAGHVFVGTSHARLFRSEDRGRTFYECIAFLKLPGRDRWSFPPPPHIPHVRSITFDPANPEIVYIGVEEGGVIRSRNRGETFELLNHGIYADVHTLAVDPSNSLRLYATTGAGFYLSEDAGASWQPIKRGIDRSYTVPLVAARDDGVIYTAAASGPPPSWDMGPRGADARLFRSADHGHSFETLPALDPHMRGMVMRMAPDPYHAREFFAVTNDGSVFRSREQGAQLVPIATRLPPAYDAVALP